MFHKVDQTLKTIKQNLYNQISKYPAGTPKILLIGITGSGKSTVMRCLADNDLIVEEGAGNRIQLSGKGIFSGSKSGTREPVLYYDNENKVLLCDCPGFEDTEGTIQEIINSFSDDFLLTKTDSDVYVKIILVITASEFETGRGKFLTDTFNRLGKMFADVDSLKQGIGVVITKSNEDNTGVDYFTQLKERAKPEIKDWCNFFIRNENQVFTFPYARRRDIGKRYDFIDHQKLVDFIITSDNYIENPETNIVIDERSQSELLNIRTDHMKMKDIITQLFYRISGQYRSAGDSKKIEDWINIMTKMFNQDIKKVNEIKEVFYENIPNCQQYEKFFDDLKEYEAIDSFFDRIFGIDNVTSSVKDVFRDLVYSALSELKTNHSYAQAKEVLEKENKENKDKIDNMMSINKQQTDQINNLTRNVDMLNSQNIEANNKCYRMAEQMKDIQREHQSQINRIEEKMVEERQKNDEYVKSLLDEIKDVTDSKNDEINRLYDIVEDQKRMFDDHLKNLQPTERIIEHHDSGGCLLI